MKRKMIHYQDLAELLPVFLADQDASVHDFQHCVGEFVYRLLVANGETLDDASAFTQNALEVTARRIAARPE